jgi:hypothetical protein
MAVEFNQSNSYSGQNPTITIAVTGSDRLLMVHPTCVQGAERSLGTCTINGISASHIDNTGLSVDGGLAAQGNYAYFNEAAIVSIGGAGSYAVVVEWGGSSSQESLIVSELKNVDQTSSVGTVSGSTISKATATNQADGSTITANLTGAAAKFVYSWVVTADSATQTGSGGNSPSANLTEQIENPVARQRMSIATDDSAASSNEDYSWTFSVNGSASVDSIVLAAVVINAAAGGSGSIIPQIMHHRRQMQ